jgi:D-glycero-alpha-D-manno-heptose-7-phosphate kinase
VRAPLRVSFGGGGTDLPSWYERHGGFVVSAAIDRHVWMLANTAFQQRYRLKHMEWEEVDHPSEIRHPILNAALGRHWNGRPIEIASVADVPAGTGLGSSGAYAVCLLKALRLAAGGDSTPAELAEAASEIEIEVLGRKVGKQDNYVAAYGGLNSYTFSKDGSVEVRPLEVGDRLREALRERFLLFFTGESRSAGDLLSHSVERTEAGDPRMAETLQSIGELAREMCVALEAEDLGRVGELMNVHWELKSQRAPGTHTERARDLRERALSAGGLGAGLMGAGGGGFLLVYSEDPERTRAAMRDGGADELPFGLSESGVSARD